MQFFTFFRLENGNLGTVWEAVLDFYSPTEVEKLNFLGF